MSSTQAVTEPASKSQAVPAVDLKLEVIPLPVSDVDRAKRFYQGLGWRLDADFASGDEWRVVQMTPPGSPCSVMFGTDITTAVPGSSQGAFLVVDDIDAARAELARHGAEVSAVFHFESDLLRFAGTKGRVPGPDPGDRSYFSFASFSDPDGNSWLIQEVTSRFPGRGFSSDVASMTELLREAETRHGLDAQAGPAHHWSQWYSAFIVARERGKTSDEASTEATLHLTRSAEAAGA